MGDASRITSEPLFQSTLIVRLALPKFKLDSEAEMTDFDGTLTNGAGTQAIAMDVDEEGAKAVYDQKQTDSEDEGLIEPFSIPHIRPVVIANKPFYAIISTQVGGEEKI